MDKNTTFRQTVSELSGGIELRELEPMAKHTSFRVGGPAQIMAFPKNADEVIKLWKLSALLDIKPAILGAGTNILAPDEGMPGIVICLKDGLTRLERIDRTHIRAEAGVTLAAAAVYAAGLSLGGMEFAHGIPGTVGGGVYMNAGAYGGQIADICESAEVLLPDGTTAVLTARELDFSYRHSAIADRNAIVLSATFALKEKPEEEIRADMQALMAKRKASQPLELPSAGSAFKRPVGGYAAALIEQTGLKGFRVGDAAVSEKHAGFVVNCGSATAQDVRELLTQVSDRVFDATGIRLEPEIRIW